jgi:hypothetical protein
MSTAPRPVRRVVAFRNISLLTGGSIASVWFGGFGRVNGEERREIKKIWGGVGFCFPCLSSLPLLVEENFRVCLVEERGGTY